MFVADSKVASAPGKDALRTTAAPSWRRIIQPVEPFLDKVSQSLADQVRGFDPEIMPYAEYALNGAGKHLRPALVALVAKSLGQVRDSHITVAVVIEMIHLATLVHDDIMDEAEIRRGHPTLASRWGNDIAVLFGDCLFGQALVLAAGFPTPEICRAVAAATNTVCSGEIIQTRLRGDFNLSLEKYFKVLEMKTAELFALSCELSAVMSDASPQQRAALRQFGLAFGIAYQIYDDCLDLFGNESVAGKSLGTDLAKGKLTLPILLAWQQADAIDRDQLQRVVENWSNNPSGDVVSELLSKYDTLRGSIERLGGFLATARQALSVLPETKGRLALASLTDYLARHTEELGLAAEGRP